MYKNIDCDTMSLTFAFLCVMHLPFSEVSWRMPLPPYILLPSALCSLSAHRRHAISKVRLKIFEYKAAFHTLHNSKPKSDASVEAATPKYLCNHQQ